MVVVVMVVIMETEVGEGVADVWCIVVGGVKSGPVRDEKLHDVCDTIYVICRGTLSCCPCLPLFALLL